MLLSAFSPLLDLKLNMLVVGLCQVISLLAWGQVVCYWEVNYWLCLLTVRLLSGWKRRERFFSYCTIFVQSCASSWLCHESHRWLHLEILTSQSSHKKTCWRLKAWAITTYGNEVDSSLLLQKPYICPGLNKAFICSTLRRIILGETFWDLYFTLYHCSYLVTRTMLLERISRHVVWPQPGIWDICFGYNPLLSVN